MAAPVEIRFVVAGTSEVARAFQSVEQSILKTDRATRKAYEADEKMSARLAAYKERLAQKTALEQERMAQRSYRENARVTTEEVRGAEKGAAQKLKAEEAYAKQRMAIQLRSADMAYKLAEQEVRAHERMLAEKQRASERYGRMMARAATSSVGGMMNVGSHIAGAALALGGGFSLADVTQGMFASQRAAQQIVNATTAGGGPRAKGQDVDSIMRLASGPAARLGMKKEDVLQGGLAFARAAKGGNFKNVQENMPFMAELSKTYGVNISDVGTAMGTLVSQNKTLLNDPAQLRQMMINTIAQSAQGSVSPVEAAKQFGKMGSTRGFYQGNEARNQMALFGLGQIGAPAGSADEIGTMTKNLALMAMKHQKELKGFGVKFDKSGAIESPEELIAKTFKGTGGDMGKIAKIFGPRALPIFAQLEGAFKEGGGGEAGAQAVKRQIAEVTTASMSPEEFQKHVEETMATSSEKIASATEKIREMFEDKLAPKIEQFADWLGKPETQKKIQDIIDALAKLADFLIENPFKGIGYLVLAKVGADLAMAGIGAAVRGQLVSLLGGGGTPGAGGGGTPGAGGGSAKNQVAGTVALMAAGGSAIDLASAGKAAYQARGGGASAMAAKYLGEWQDGNFGWVGGASWNPLVSGARKYAETMSDQGGIKANPDAPSAQASNGHRQMDEQTKILKSIDGKIGGSSGSMATPDNPNRQYPLGKGARP